MAKERRQKLTCLSAAPARPEEACSAGPPGRLCRPGFPGGVGKAPAAAGLPGTATRLPSLPRRLYVYRKITPKVRGRRKKTGPRLAVPARPGEHRCSTAGALRGAPGSRAGQVVLAGPPGGTSLFDRRGPRGGPRVPGPGKSSWPPARGAHRCSTAGALRGAPGFRAGQAVLSARPGGTTLFDRRGPEWGPGFPGGASPSGGFPFVVLLRQIPGGVVVPGGRPRGGGWQGVGKNSKISFEGFFFQGRGRRRRAGKRFLRRLYVYWKTTPKVRGAR
jgi:hypothetical protein